MHVHTNVYTLATYKHTWTLMYDLYSQTLMLDYLHTFVHTWMHAYTCTYINTYIHTCLSTHVHIYLLGNMHDCVLPIWLQTYINTYMPQTYSFMHICIHTNMCMHTRYMYVCTDVHGHAYICHKMKDA